MLKQSSLIIKTNVFEVLYGKGKKAR